MRTEADKQRVLSEQAKINEKKLKQANSAFKGMNPWNSSYTTLLLHKQVVTELFILAISRFKYNRTAFGDKQC